MPKPKAIGIEDKDVPLRDDIRLLGRILGDTIHEQILSDTVSIFARR